VQWLRQLVAGLSPHKFELAPGSIHVGFEMDRVALGQVLPRVFGFSPVIIITQWLSMHTYRVSVNRISDFDFLLIRATLSYIYKTHTN
jgi:hypothetical protein